MKEFTTAATKVLDEEEGVEQEWVEFKVDGEVWKRLAEPSATQLALLMASFGRHASDSDRMAGIIDFFVSVLDDETHTRVVERLYDQKDSFGLDEIEGICKWILEDQTARPTEPRSGSTGSQRTTGRRSTRTTSLSTS